MKYIYKCDNMRDKKGRSEMEFQVLKKDNLKRNIIIGVFAVLIISAVVLNFTRAKYRSTASVPIVDSEVNYSRPDLEIIALYINGVESEELDSNTNYTLDTASSTCTYKDGTTIDNLTLSYDSETKTFTIAPYTTKGTKCTLYFEEAEEKEYTLKINYEYAPGEEGDIKISSYVATVAVGFGYFRASPDIDNYIAVPEQVRGEMPDHDLTITVIYYKDLNGNKIPDSSE